MANEYRMQYEHLRDLPSWSLSAAEVGMLLDRIKELEAALEAERESLRLATDEGLRAW